MQQTYSDFKNTNSVSVFQGSITNTAVVPVHVWNKPKDCTLVYIYAIGGGGGGGGGICPTKPTFTYNGGGSGGGAGSHYAAIYPANILPDVLYASPGYGGSGGVGQVYGNSTGNTGTGGGSSKVSAFAPINGAYDDSFASICVALGGNGGAGGTNTVNYAAATNGGGIYSLGTTTWKPSSVRYDRIFQVGSAGAGANGAGSIIANVTSVGFSNNIPFLPSGVNNINVNVLCKGGTAGGYAVSSASVTPSSYSGGNILLDYTILSSLYPNFSSGFIPGGLSGSVRSDGLNGIGYGLDLTNLNYNNLNLIHPLFFTGGTGGGGCHGDDYGGNGGHGGLGCGGGGGGGSAARSSPYRGGNGGNGGPGFIIIIAI